MKRTVWCLSYKAKSRISKVKVIQKDSFQSSFFYKVISTDFNPRTQCFTLIVNDFSNHAGFYNSFHHLRFKILAELGNQQYRSAFKKALVIAHTPMIPGPGVEPFKGLRESSAANREDFQGNEKPELFPVPILIHPHSKYCPVFIIDI